MTTANPIPDPLPTDTTQPTTTADTAALQDPSTITDTKQPPNDTTMTTPDMSTDVLTDTARGDTVANQPASENKHDTGNKTDPDTQSDDTINQSSNQTGKDKQDAVSDDTQPDDSASAKAPFHALPSQVKLTGRMLNFTRLHIQGNDIPDILAKLEKKLGAKRQSKLPVVVSCEHELDLTTLWSGLWKLGLQPIGMITGILDKQAEAIPVAIFPVDGQRIDGKAAKKPEPAQHTDTPTPHADATLSLDNGSYAEDKLSISSEQVSHVEGDLVHNQMLRSGQSINHVGGDLILTRGINAGAEAITDYSLHVYGKAEGRLVAGATGDKNAKIFCLRFNPSLVSVAGTYCLRENIPADLLNKAVQVSYAEDKGLVFTLMEI